MPPCVTVLCALLVRCSIVDFHLASSIFSLCLFSLSSSVHNTAHLYQSPSSRMSSLSPRALCCWDIIFFISPPCSSYDEQHVYNGLPLELINPDDEGKEDLHHSRTFNLQPKSTTRQASGSNSGPITRQLCQDSNSELCDHLVRTTDAPWWSPTRHKDVGPW
jgi:hypothetical protein